MSVNKTSHIGDFLKCLFIFIPALYLFPPIAFTQDNSSSKASLTWDQCLSETIKNNPDLMSAQQEYQKGIYLYRQSFATFYPHVNLTGSYRRGTSSGTQLYSPDPVDQFSLGVTASENIFNGFGDKAELDKNSAMMNVSALDYQQAKIQISYDFTNAFTQVVYARNLVKLSGSISKQRQLNLDMVRLNFKAGTEHKGSYLLSEAYYDQAQFEAESAGRTLRSALASLSHVMGRNEIMSNAVVGEFTEPNGLDYNLDEIIKSHPLYVQDQARIKAAEAGLSLSNSGFFPTLDLNASYSVFDDHFFPELHSWYFGVSATYPLFSVASNFYASKIARADLEKSRLQLRSRYNTLMADIEQAYQTYLSAFKNLSIQEKFLEAVELRAKIGRVQYANGLLSFDNWDIIESDLITRQKNLLLARRDAALARANFDRASGRSIIP